MSEIPGYVEMIDADELDAEAAIRLGHMVSQFLRSTPGQYIESRVEDIRNRCLEEFMAADPEDVENIKRIQRNLIAPHLAIKWLDEAVRVAENTAQQQKLPRVDY